jgi:Beta-Casp domain
MQTGPSRELFELWAPDSRNGLIVTGYSIEGTLARVSDNWLVSRDGYVQRFILPVYNPNQWISIFLRCLSFGSASSFVVRININGLTLFPNIFRTS